MRIAAVLLLLLAPLAAAAAEAPWRLAPWKDGLFAYQRILAVEADGAYREVEYDRPRDLYARDEVRGTKVRPEYVSLDTDAVQQDLTVRAGGRTVHTFAVGKTEGAKAIVVFVHGRGPGRAIGVDDWVHGGNFNRIKNLMMRSGGLYLSPGFSDFGARGAADVKALVLDMAARSPGAPVFLACGSSGARICFRLARDAAVRPLLAGLILFDPVLDAGDARFLAELGVDARIPVQISASREDTTVPWRSQLAQFRRLRAAVPDYPARFVLFSAGTHGLSLRMTDWRETINWMMEEGSRQ